MCYSCWDLSEGDILTLEAFPSPFDVHGGDITSFWGKQQMFFLAGAMAPVFVCFGPLNVLILFDDLG